MWIKICGITDAATIAPLAALRPDAVGFNFYRGSKRCITVERAAEAARLLPDGIVPVGVFVNHSHDEIRSICAATRITTVQLHGDETPEFAAALKDFQVIRVFRLGADRLAPVAADLRTCRQFRLEPRACLVEPAVAGHYGGSGKTAPWDVIATEWNRLDWPPLLLAGGLTPDNVGEAVARVRPWGVDVASGVETAPGVKDLAKIERF
ncbi:MAG: phosphoribosylanthranilate isomerase, partial [Planctomycetaceae bacterium]